MGQGGPRTSPAPCPLCYRSTIEQYLLELSIANPGEFQVSDDDKKPTTTPETAADATTEANESGATETSAATEPSEDKAPPASVRPAAKVDEKPAKDLTSPDAILARVAALGEDDEIEKIARAEEAKLEERKKGGLEGAASKKLQKIGTKPKKKKLAKEQAARDAERDEEEEDEAIARVKLAPREVEGALINDWIKKNQNVVFGIFAAAALAGIGYFGLRARTEKSNQAASAILGDAVTAERGRIGDPAKEAEDELGVDPRPVFKTTAERRDAALAKYRDVQSQFPGTPAATLGRLGEAALLLDSKDGKGALAAYEDVRGSVAAKDDNRLKVRATEGIGFAQELLGAPDKALAAYKELEGLSAKGARELGLYHQARLAEAKGDKEAAQALYLKIRETTQVTGESTMFAFLGTNVDDRLKAIDPKAIPEKGGIDLGSGLSEAKMKAMQDQIQRAMQKAAEEKKGEGH
mgnify:FL=1